jgi:hypothetical protein
VARERIDAQTFKIELHGMLRIYSQSLRKEAEAPLQKTAIQFVRRYRRKIAYRIGDDLFADAPSKTPAENAIVAPRLPIPIIESSDDDDGDDAVEDFQRMKDFLVNSLAFKRLKEQLIRFLDQSIPDPTDRPDILDTTTTPGEQSSNMTLESPASAKSLSHVEVERMSGIDRDKSESVYDEMPEALAVPGSFPEEFDATTESDILLSFPKSFKSFKELLVGFLALNIPLSLNPTHPLETTITGITPTNQASRIETPHPAVIEPWPGLVGERISRNNREDNKIVYGEKLAEAADVVLPGSFPVDEFDTTNEPDILFSLSKLIQWGYTVAIRFLRKRPEPGLRRIEWTCVVLYTSPRSYKANLTIGLWLAFIWRLL